LYLSHQRSYTSQCLLPKEFSVGIYLPSRDLYNPQLMEEVIRAMPDVKFYLFGDESRKGQKGDNVGLPRLHRL